jgi:hypothetical protein
VANTLGAYAGVAANSLGTLGQAGPPKVAAPPTTPLFAPKGLQPARLRSPHGLRQTGSDTIGVATVRHPFSRLPIFTSGRARLSDALRKRGPIAF